MNPLGLSQVILLPAQLGRLAELYPDGGAVDISQTGSVISAHNGTMSVKLDAQGHKLDDPKHPNQETLPLC